MVWSEVQASVFIMMFVVVFFVVVLISPGDFNAQFEEETAGLDD